MSELEAKHQAPPVTAEEERVQRPGEPCLSFQGYALIGLRNAATLRLSVDVPLAAGFQTSEMLLEAIKCAGARLLKDPHVLSAMRVSYRGEADLDAVLRPLVDAAAEMDEPERRRAAEEAIEKCAGAIKASARARVCLSGKAGQWWADNFPARLVEEGPGRAAFLRVRTGVELLTYIAASDVHGFLKLTSPSTLQLRRVCLALALVISIWGPIRNDTNDQDDIDRVGVIGELERRRFTNLRSGAENPHSGARLLSVAFEAWGAELKTSSWGSLPAAAAGKIKIKIALSTIDCLV
eukprot:tig00000912_g5452.t1